MLMVTIVASGTVVGKGRRQDHSVSRAFVYVTNRSVTRIGLPARLGRCSRSYSLEHSCGTVRRRPTRYDDPFEIDRQAAHPFKHPHVGLADVLDDWASDPLFYPARPPAHWLMVAEVSGTILVSHWRRHEAATLGGVDPLAVARHPTCWTAHTGRTDE